MCMFVYIVSLSWVNFIKENDWNLLENQSLDKHNTRLAERLYIYL